MIECTAPVPEKSHLRLGNDCGEILGSQRCCDLQMEEVRYTPMIGSSHSHVLAFFSLVLDGGSTESRGPRTLQLKQHTVVYRSSGVTHSLNIGRAGLRVFVVHVAESWLERMRQYGPLGHLSLGPLGGDIPWLAARLHREYRDKAPHSSLAIEGLILEMLAALLRNSKIIDNQQPGWLSKVRDILHAEYARNISLSRIADEVGIHPYDLSKLFRKFQNQTVAEYIQDLRVKHASRQLLEPEAVLSDIALSAGFSDQSHLTRVFKRVTGLTPGAFRSTHLADRHVFDSAKL